MLITDRIHSICISVQMIMIKGYLSKLVCFLLFLQFVIVLNFKFMKKLIYIILSVVIFASCEKIVDIDIEENDHKIVVNSMVTSNNTLIAHVSRSLGILEESDLWDGKTNVMQVTNATDRTLEIRALMSAADSPTAWDLRVLVREKLIAYLQKNHPASLPRTRIEMTDQTDHPAKDSVSWNSPDEEGL